MLKIFQNDGRTYITVIEDNGTVSEYRTNRDGDGLFRWSGATAEWRQIIGTGQINLRGPRSTIRARFLRAIPE